MTLSDFRIASGLEDAIQLLAVAETYEEYAEGATQVLTQVHTEEELDRARRIIDEKKSDLMEINPEFKAVMAQQQWEQKDEYDSVVHGIMMSEVVIKAQRTITDAKATTSTSRAGVDDWRTKFKVIVPEEWERQREKQLGCPNPRCKDHGKNRRNVMNGVPRCMVCFHGLVKKSEFRDYNRKYWREYNRNRKKS